MDLENFRQYNGNQRIRFGQSSNRNVTLLYGANGSGKTTLLNAFLWVLYDDMTDDLEEQDRLVSEHVWGTAKLGERVPVSVLLEFEHDNITYLVKRSTTAEKRGIEQALPPSRLEMWHLDTDGAKREVISPKSQIDRILPPRLSKFFFVNGERIEHLVRKDAYSEIQDAIKTLLGLETLDRALKHLPAVKQKLRRKIKSDGRGQSIDKLADAIDNINLKIEQETARRDQLKLEAQSLRDDITAISNRLLAAKETKDLQNERQDLEEREKKHKQQTKEQQERISSIVNREGYLAFLGSMAAQVSKISDKHRESGNLPAPLKGTFIDDLLNKGTCICGMELVQGSTHRRALEEWRQRVGLADVDAAWSSLHGAMTTFDDQRTKVFTDITDADIAEAGARTDLNVVQGRLSDIAKLIKEAGGEVKPHVLEKSREEMLDRLQDTSRELGAVQDRINSEINERDKKEREIEQQNIKGEANKRVQQRIAVVKEVEDALAEVRRIASDGTRKRLDKRIKDIFTQASIKKYEPRLTEDFQLEYWQCLETGELLPAPKSTGENMLLSLSFVAAVAAECRDGQGKGALFPGVGGEFPIVMDAAFGNLDDDYRRHIAKFLPDMTSQVVVLTSKAQAAGVVEEELRDRVGAQYVITTHTTKQDVADVTEAISVNGREYRYQVIGSDRDGAELTGVQA